MFIDLTEPERLRFIKQTHGSHIPGYTGHCPTLKFRHGNRFGADTKAIIEELRDISPISKDPPYRHDDVNSGLITATIKSKDVQSDTIGVTNLPKRPYVLGYTGYIPGLNFTYGSSYSNLADKSVLQFLTRVSDEEKRREKDRLSFISTKPQLVSIRGLDDITKEIEHYGSLNQPAPELPISTDLPPIAGYTGHIPRLKGNERSLSQRYFCSAKAGLALLNDERQRRRSLSLAKEAVRDAIAYSHVH